MSALRKFTFDLADAPPPSKTLPEDELDQLLAAAREEGHRQGFEAGQAAVAAQSAAALAQSAGALTDRVALVLGAVGDYEARHLSQSVELAASVARKLAAHLIAREPQAELAALVAECMASLEAAPHMVIRCHPDLCDAIKPIAEERMKIAGVTGRLVVLGDPEIGLGDGRIEWADGGLVRDLNAISGEIDARISAYLAARTPRQKG